MEKKLTQYNYETRNIDINAIFPSFSKLFCAVTGRKPPTGKNNLDIVKANLSRYLEYRKLCEADPSCVKKNAVIVTKIHNPPLPKENDGRGKHGIYADDIKPLLVSLGTFEGKYSTLANQVGVFSRYFDELKKNNSELMKQLERQTNELDYNLWKRNEFMAPGEKEYRSIISEKVKDILKSNLEALHREGTVQYEAHYKIIPDTSLTMEDYRTRPMSKAEEIEGWEEHRRAIEGEASQKNSVLNTELAEHLIFGIDKAYSLDYQLLRAGENPVICSPEQEAAIENYQFYVRQCAMKEYRHLDKLPVVDGEELITKSGLFFQNPRLVQIYNKIDNKLRPLLFGNIRFWREIEYRVIDEKKAERYLKGFDQRQSANRLSQKILEYMDKQLENHIVEAKPDDWKDIPGAFGRVPDGALRRYQSAVKLHKKLKGLYGMNDKDGSNDTDISTGQEINAVSG